MDVILWIYNYFSIRYKTIIVFSSNYRTSIRPIRTIKLKSNALIFGKNTRVEYPSFVCVPFHSRFVNDYKRLNRIDGFTYLQLFYDSLCRCGVVYL